MISLFLYLSTFFISLLFCYFLEKDNYIFTNTDFAVTKKGLSLKVGFLKRILFFIIVFFPIVLLAGLRYFVGTDFLNYMELYNVISMADFKEVIRQTNFNEALFVFLNKLSSIIFLKNTSGIFISSSFITFFFLYKSLIYFKRKYNISITVSIYIFYFYFFALTLNIQRQMLAVTIILFAITKLIEKKYISFAVYVLIASGFHNSAILCMSFLLFRVFANYDKIINIFLLLSPFFTDIMMNIAVKLPFLSKYFSRYEFRKDNVSIVSLIEISLFLLPLFINRRNILNKYPSTKFLFSISLLNVLFVFLSSYQHWLSRVMYFTMILQVLLIPLIIDVQTPNRKVWYRLFYFLFFFSYFILKFYVVGTEEIFPYRTKNILF